MTTFFIGVAYPTIEFYEVKLLGKLVWHAAQLNFIKFKKVVKAPGWVGIPWDVSIVFNTPGSTVAATVAPIWQANAPTSRHISPFGSRLDSQ